MFGYMKYSRRLQFLSDANAAYPLSETNYIVGDVSWQIGAQYAETIKDKYFLILGANYEIGSSLKTEGTLVNQVIFPGQTAQINDSTVISNFFNIKNETLDGNIDYPSTLGLGVSFGIKNSLTLTADYSMQDWSNSMIVGRYDSLSNSTSYNFGAEYIPSTSTLRSYMSRINYRLGGYYSNSYISLYGNQIIDYGMTFGVGLPFRNTKTTFNVAGILGQRGTTENNLIKENYGIVHIGVVFHDIWFRKSKYE
jgi:long-subunit fatty acid transport protein